MPVVLITGCSSGIGRALANSFKGAGFDVWATARRPQDVEQLNAAGFQGRALDVNDENAVGQLLSDIEQYSGNLDVLINNAGYGAMGPLLDLDTEALGRQFQTNVFALVAVTRASLPLLRRSRGQVVNIGSVSGLVVTPFAGAYCASKAAVHAISDALRLELAPFGIRVMEVQPGAIASRFADSASAEAEQVIATGSAWWPVREHIRARARASQGNPTAAVEVAERILAAVQQSVPPSRVRVGNGCRVLPMLARWVPKGLLEWGLRRAFGLNRSL